MDTPHKKSIGQQHCWTPEGKITKPDDRNWSIKPKKYRGCLTKNWTSKSDEYRRAYIKKILKNK